MTTSLETLHTWLTEIANTIKTQGEPQLQHDHYFLSNPALGMQVIQLMNQLDENESDQEPSYYTACIFSIDICVAQLQMVFEGGSKLAEKALNELMDHLAATILLKTHSLGFWLPVLNAFYEVHANLTTALKDAYYELAYEEAENSEPDDGAHLHSIRELIEELADLSVFDIAEHFFSQSYAMPAEFFADLVIDLYELDEGKDIALLTLLHPSAEVREIVVAMHEEILHDICLSSLSLSRLQSIKSWYPRSYHAQFERWIKIQRKKAVVFHSEIKTPALSILASEVDGSGAQGLFIHMKQGRRHRLAGILLKQGVGIKEAWLTPHLTKQEMQDYFNEAFDDHLSLRPVNTDYLQQMIQHFLALSIEQGQIPDLHLLEIQETLGLHWKPLQINPKELLDDLAIQISPFTQESLQNSLKRSKAWAKNKAFTASWYLENAHIDKLVNRSSSYIDGVKVCRFNEALDAVFTEEMEPDREKWIFHFLWISLWLKSKARKNDKSWQDSFFIAYALHNGSPLKDIPLLKEICYQSVVNSIETMQERRTHLSGP
jgi:hypothetical protein